MSWTQFIIFSNFHISPKPHYLKRTFYLMSLEIFDFFYFKLHRASLSYIWCTFFVSVGKICRSLQFRSLKWRKFILNTSSESNF